MNGETGLVLAYLELGGILAPLAFILIHILRPFLFIPVVVMCMAGGVLFGAVFGTAFSLIGLTISSFSLYFLLKRFPILHRRLRRIKIKWFGPYKNLTGGQIAVLKMIPFIHFQLLCFCLIERKGNFREYAGSSFFTNLPVAVFYTVFGKSFQQISPAAFLLFLLVLTVLIVVLREKFAVIKWKDFFKAAS